MQKSTEIPTASMALRQLESTPSAKPVRRHGTVLLPLAAENSISGDSPEAGGLPNQTAPVLLPSTPQRNQNMGSRLGAAVLPTSLRSQHTQRLGSIPQKYTTPEADATAGRRALNKRLSAPSASSLPQSRRSSTLASVKLDWGQKRPSVKSRKHSVLGFNDIGASGMAGGEHQKWNNRKGSDSDSSSSSDDEGMLGLSEARRRQQFFRDAVGPVEYHDGKKVLKGSVDQRGITPHVTFTTTETPASEANNPLVTCVQPVTCGFCSSTNLVWVLRCSFCGSARMSDAPRLKYLIDMILSVDPLIKAEKLAKRVLDYAKFDRVAMKVESTFKQAGLVRAKAAIMMMNRTILLLRHQMLRMVFAAWKRANAHLSRQDTNLQRVISIKESQTKRKIREDVFSVWRGYAIRKSEERLQRFTTAYKRNEMTRLRRIWGDWQSFMRRRAKQRLEETKTYYEHELNNTPLEAQKEIDRLKQNQQDTLKLAFAAGDMIQDLLRLSLRKMDHNLHKTMQLNQMYAETAGTFFEDSHGQELLDALSSGHTVPPTLELGKDDAKDEANMQQLLMQTKDQIDRAPPSDSLVAWLNFQRRRGAEYGQVEIPDNSVKALSNGSSSSKTAAGSGASVVDKLSSSGARPGGKMRLKEKKKEFKPIKYLQDLRAVIASPGVMLKLLCHTSAEAQTEYERLRSAEPTNSTASAAAENSTTSTILSPSAQLQLKSYFKLVHRMLNLPPDIVSRESFVLNDFDSLYAYVVYLYLFHTNYIAPGMELSPRYHLSYDFLEPQWKKVKTSLLENDCDPFAQQQFYIFLTKMTRLNTQFLRFGSICKAVSQIAHWHEKAVMRDAYNDFSRRVLGKDSNISVALEKETLASWVSLPASKLLSLCESEDEFCKIEQVFKDNVLDLIKIFRIYGSAAGGKGILEQEFLKVMTKAGVTNKKNILRSHLQLIYQQSRQANGGFPLDAPTSGNGIGLGSGGDGEDDTDDRGATPNEFFEALTRVAHHNYQKRREAAGQIASLMNVASDGTIANAVGASSLLSFVVDLVVDKVVPLTKKFQEQGLTFKKQMIHPDVQHVCKAQEKKLKRVFSTYSQKNKNPGSRGKLLDLSDFEGLLKDRRLVDALFPHGKIKQLVAFVQQDGEIANTASSITGYDADSEFVFSEFVEALSAIAVYRNANPYLPFAKKLENFFEENF